MTTNKNTFREIARAHIAYVLSADYEGREALTNDYCYREWLKAIEWHFAEMPNENGRYDLTIAIDGDAVVIPVDVSDPEKVRKTITPLALFRASDPGAAQFTALDRAELWIRDALRGNDKGLRSLKNEDAKIIYDKWSRLAHFHLDTKPTENGYYEVKFWDEAGCVDDVTYVDIWDLDEFKRSFNSHNLYYSYVKPAYRDDWTETEAAGILSHSRTSAKDFFNTDERYLSIHAWGKDGGTLGEAFKDFADEGMDYLMHDPQTIFYKGYIVADTAAY